MNKSPGAIQDEIALKKERLSLYYQRETLMLSPDGVKSYGIGPRNLSRYDTALADIQKMIKQLEVEISNLEGTNKRKAVAVVPRDW